MVAPPKYFVLQPPFVCNHTNGPYLYVAAHGDAQVAELPVEQPTEGLAGARSSVKSGGGTRNAGFTVTSGLASSCPR